LTSGWAPRGTPEHTWTDDLNQVRPRQGYLGVYGSTVRSGRIAVGDPVVIERGDVRAALTAPDDTCWRILQL
jgi:MOSC domain-containing protein YiiM